MENNKNVTENRQKGPDNLALSLEDAARSLSVSPSFIRLEIARGRLGAIHLGRRVVIRQREIECYLAGLS